MSVSSGWALAGWTASAVLLWTWLGYPLLVRLMARAGVRGEGRGDGTPPVETSKTPAAARTAPTSATLRPTIIIPVHNAAAALEAKLDGLAYLRDERGDGTGQEADSAHALDPDVEVIVALDGCTDASATVVQRAAAAGLPVRCVELPARSGKSAAQNLAAEAARGDVLVLTDVSTSFEERSLQALLDAFMDPEVGYVAGNLRWRAGASELERSGSSYAGWERRLWDAEAALGLLHVAPGAFMAVRRACFRPLEHDVGDDAMIPLDVVARGRRGAFARDAVAWDTHHRTLASEYRARVRMTSRSLRATLRGIVRGRLWRRPGLFAAVVSHRLLRWTTPYWLLLAGVGWGGAWAASVGRPLHPGAALVGGLAALLAVALPGVRRRLAAGLVVNAGFAMGCVGAFTGVGRGAYATGAGEGHTEGAAGAAEGRAEGAAEGTGAPRAQDSV